MTQQSDVMAVDAPLGAGDAAAMMPPPPAPGDTMADLAPMMDIPMVSERLLIGFGGKCEIKNGAKPVIDGHADMSTFISEFKSKHCIITERVQPILALLKMGGMSRERIAREILVILTDHFKRKIIDLSQPQLTKLLDKSYTYLTVPELRPIAILVLERLDHVDTNTWQEIVNNGLTESPYIHLPTSIKRRIWLAVPSSFIFELKELIKTIPDHEESPNFEFYITQEDRMKARNENVVLQNFLKLLGQSDALLVQFIDKMVEVAAMETSTPRRLAYANLFHDILAVATPRQMPNVEKLRKMARFLDRGGESKQMELAQVRDIREGLSENASCGPVALLVSSTYTRDLVTDQLVHNLVTQRKALPLHASPHDFQVRAQELQRDPFLKDLTYICVSNIKSQQLLMENVPLHDSATEAYYLDFYPRICNEMAFDDRQMQDGYHTGNARVADHALLQAVQKDAYERRIVVSYGLILYSRNNIIGLSKMRLVLDYALQRCDTVDEAKECTIAHGLIMHVMDHP